MTEKHNAEDLRQKMEQEQDNSLRDAAFFTSLVVIVVTSPLLFNALLNNRSVPEKPVRHIATHSLTNAPSTNVFYKGNQR